MKSANLIDKIYLALSKVYPGEESIELIMGRQARLQEIVSEGEPYLKGTRNEEKLYSIMTIIYCLQARISEITCDFHGKYICLNGADRCVQKVSSIRESRR